MSDEQHEHQDQPTYFTGDGCGTMLAVLAALAAAVDAVPVDSFTIESTHLRAGAVAQVEDGDVAVVVCTDGAGAFGYHVWLRPDSANSDDLRILTQTSIATEARAVFTRAHLALIRADAGEDLGEVLADLDLAA